MLMDLIFNMLRQISPPGFPIAGMQFPKWLLLTVLLLLAGFRNTSAQTCTALGQTPATAFPVCGTSSFQQATVPLCDNGSVPTNCHDGVDYTSVNPYWYKFTCFQGGTLGFLVTPNNVSDDYDWQLWDITGYDPGSVYSAPIVSGNWSAITGATGAVNDGSGSTNCAGDAYPNKNSMPTLIQGHNYLLLVSHFTQTQSGYSLTFGGGTASITDTVTPAVQSVKPSCDGSRLTIVLNKSMQCSSVASDGSDFTLSPAVSGVKITGATTNCSGFDMDTVIALLSNPLPPGNYTVSVQTGTDGNTILDNCGAAIPVGQSASFVMTPPQASPMDSLTPPGCAPSTLKLVFSQPILCSSIAADGSDFTVQGSSPVTVTGAAGLCDSDNSSYVVLVNLSAPIQTAGTYQISLKTGDDGNTLINECGISTPAATLSFTTGDTVSAALLGEVVKYGCEADTIVYGYPPANGVDQWNWTFDSTVTSAVEYPPAQVYTIFGTETAKLIVSNGYCSDSTQVTTVLNNGIRAAFSTDTTLCPTDEATFANGSTGIIDAYRWEFGDGTGDNDENPPGHLYPQTGKETIYTVTLTVSDSLGCTETATHLIDVLRSCYIAVPGAFTPNGDGTNDYLYPLNAYNANNLIFRVFNRYGQQVFLSTTWTQKWDGTFQGHQEPAGAYVWMLEYNDRNTGKHYFLKGTSILIR
jgi:gliding motility-associated-like protein